MRRKASIKWKQQLQIFGEKALMHNKQLMIEKKALKWNSWGRRCFIPVSNALLSHVLIET